VQYRHPIGVIAKVVGLLTCLALFLAAVRGMFIFLPLAVLLAIPVAILWRLDRPRILPGHCTTCGYDLTGNESGRCPECGKSVSTSIDASSGPAADDPSREMSGKSMMQPFTPQEVLRNRTAPETRPE
jgi:hypothetical protein